MGRYETFEQARWHFTMLLVIPFTWSDAARSSQFRGLSCCLVDRQEVDLPDWEIAGKALRPASVHSSLAEASAVVGTAWRLLHSWCSEACGAEMKLNSSSPMTGIARHKAGKRGDAQRILDMGRHGSSCGIM